MTKLKNPYLKKERLEMFCDGVFAIVITILILEIKVPHHEDLERNGGLYCSLVKLWPAYVSYIVSFLTVGIYWSNHHWLFSFIKKTNHVFNLLNILFLMTVAVMPFTTAVLSEYILEHEYMNAAVTTFSIGYILPIPFITFVFLYAVHRRRLVDPNLSPRFIRNLLVKLVSGMVCATIAILLSVSYPLMSLIILGAAMLAYLLPPETPSYIIDGREVHVEEE